MPDYICDKIVIFKISLDDLPWPRNTRKKLKGNGRAGTPPSYRHVTCSSDFLKDDDDKNKLPIQLYGVYADTAGQTPMNDRAPMIAAELNYPPAGLQAAPQPDRSSDLGRCMHGRMADASEHEERSQSKLALIELGPQRH